ncbi:glycoside hydrolase family 3 C-terminal domain-containing protein [Bacteroides ovatus]|nr:glycoside hydrolase family 3 C-terminal domain-containing protein [Bacteroides ovatus]
MNFLKLNVCVAIGLMSLSGLSAANKKTGKVLPYKNPKLSIEQRVEDLLSRMTLEEKVRQLSALRMGEGDEVFRTSGHYSEDNVRKQFGTHGMGHISLPLTDLDAAAAVRTANMMQKIALEETRLGIPVLINDEACHGYIGRGATSYPQSIALSSTWDLNLMSEIADAIGKEASSRGVHQVFSPVLDLGRDPRHGRTEETYGEDPYLASRFGVEFIKGIQSHNVMCTPKHFLANFTSEGGRDSGNSSLSERELREVHMVPYAAAFKEAKAKSVMVAYNTIDGVPCAANRWLLNDLLRKEWGFDGFVVSDWSAVIHSFGYLHIAPTLEDAAAMCLEAGMDVELPRPKGYINFAQRVRDGKMDEKVIDTSVRRVLRRKFEMGLFENPYKDVETAVKLCDSFRDLARKAARESIILLKNDKQTLPLKQGGKIAVIGPNANVLRLGGYTALGVKGATPLDGIKSAFGDDTEIFYAKGCALNTKDKSGFQEAIETAKKADVCVLVMGGNYNETGGETRDRASLDLMGVQEDLILEIAQLGKPVVVVLVEGRPVTMTRWKDKVNAITVMYFGGEEGGNALGEILCGKVNPSGKITIGYPLLTGDCPMTYSQRPYGREGGIKEYSLAFLPNNRYSPLFPFGYGLSYTTYEYKNLKLSKVNLDRNDNVQLSVEITNTGTVDGDEIVQVYLSDPYCRITQPVKKLKAFKRVHIPAGKTRTVSFTLDNSDLTFLNEKLQPEIDLGEFEVFVGTNSQKGLKQRFTVH